MIGALAAGAAASKNKYVGISTLLVVIAVIVLAFIILNKVFGGINGILESFGLKDSEEDIKLNEDLKNKFSNSSNPSNPFSPSFYKSAPSGSLLFNVAKADSLAEQLYDSVGILYDDPESGLAAIKQCRAASQVSFLADRFNILYKKDLISWLSIKYDTSNQKKVLNEIYDYVSRLPKYN